jgi:Xaa-Pro aminopeptidase
MGRYDERRSRLMAQCADRVDGVLVTRLVNVRYLSGFTGSYAALLVAGSGAASCLATDGRYLVQAAEQAPDLECVSARGTAVALVERAESQGVGRLGIEARHVTLAAYDELRAAGERIELVALPPVVEPLRAVKDAVELAAIERACEITDAAFADVITRLKPGISEREVAWLLLAAMREHGADGAAFESIVAFGPHSAIPHHDPTQRGLQAGDLVKLDFGALVDGYHADMTRTVAMPPVADWQRDLHAEVLAIQERCREACRVGAVPRRLDEAAAAAIAGGGHEVAHGLGHGVGLEIHEDPFLTPRSDARPLVADMAVTIEPGIYLPGRGGIRIEDTVVTGSTGARALTSSRRELLEVG